MENQTRFDLNTALENWRNELAAQPNLASDDRRELETHLRDTISELRQRGLNDEEAFWLARRRIGPPQQFGVEFEKANPTKIWRERAFWIVASVITFQIWGSASFGLFSILTTFLRPYYHFQSVSFVLSMLFYVLPVVCVMVWIASGRMARFLAKLSMFFWSQLRLGVVACLLVVISQLINGIANWWQLRAAGPIASGTFQLFYLNLSTMIAPLILVALLVWLMPQKKKMRKRAEFLSR